MQRYVQRITVRGELFVQREAFAVEGVQAYSVDGTPADCVKVALQYLLPGTPDAVLSGVNAGYNVGFDIAYSGTVGAAMEARMQGIHAIAFSDAGNGSCEVTERYLQSVTEDLLARKLPANEIWNVNFPGCKLADFQGICEHQRPAQGQFYLDRYQRRELEGGGFVLSPCGDPTTKCPAEGTDMHAVMNGYISIGRIESQVIKRGN